MGPADTRLPALAQGRSPSALQGPDPQVWFPVLHAARLPADHRPQRLQADPGRVPQGGVHRKTDHRIHQHPGRLR